MMAAPARLKRALRKSASTKPVSPLGRIAPPISQCRGARPQAAETQNQSARLPHTRNHGLSTGEDRTHFQPSRAVWRGSRKILSPKICSSKSDHTAPNTPRRLWVWETPVAVFHEGSAEE